LQMLIGQGGFSFCRFKKAIQIKITKKKNGMFSYLIGG